MKTVNKLSAIIKGASFLLIASSLILATEASAKKGKGKDGNQVVMCLTDDSGPHEILVEDKDVASYMSIGAYLGPCVPVDGGDVPPVDDGGIAF